MESNRDFAVPETFSGLDGDGPWVRGPGLVRSLWRYRLAIVAVAALAAITGYAVSSLLPAKYEAQASLFLRDPGSPAVLSLSGFSPQSGDRAVFMATQAEFARSDQVYERALQILNRSGTPDDLRRLVVVKPSADLASLTIRATSGDPAESANLATAVGTAYQQLNGERVAADANGAVAGLQQIRAQRESEFDALRAQIAQTTGPDLSALQERASATADRIGELQVYEQEIGAQAAVYGSGVESFQEATPPVSSSQPAPLLLAVLGAVLGLVAAGGWAWWAAGRNRRVESEGDAGAVLGIPLLGETPRLDLELPGTGAPSSLPKDPVAPEAYHVVLTGLEHALSRVGGKVVAVASAGPGDGKTVTVLNLALAAKREGRKVLLVDGDERTRGLSQLCRDGELFDVIGMNHDGEEDPADTISRWSPAVPAPAIRAKVLQVGPNERNGHHPAVYFRSTAFGELISSGDPADLVLIDTPALLGVSEAVTIADHADVILLVVNRGTSLADLRRARERLAFTDTPVIGYLLNRGVGQGGYAGLRRRPGRLLRPRPAVPVGRKRHQQQGWLG
jgi:Mrp family chromosome partitioning ATPase/capsular polysaccharide biosynthesis protein